MSDWQMRVDLVKRLRRRTIDDDRHEAEFSLSVQATRLMGRKGELPIAG